MASRQTVQSEIIVGTLERMANHPTAEEVYEAVRAEHPGIGRATVFRVLGRLSDEGRIARVRINNGADHFDHRTFEHHHVRCERCGRVDDVLLEPRGREVDEAAERASGWRISGHTVQFDGVCPECQKVQAPPAE